MIDQRDENTHRRVSLLQSLMISGWIALLLVLAGVWIVLNGQVKQQRQLVADLRRQLQQTTDDLDAIKEHLVRGGPTESADPRPPADSRNGQALAAEPPSGNGTAAPPPDSPDTQPDTGGYNVPTPDLFPDPDKDRPAGLAGHFYDVMRAASPDPDSPFYLIVTGPRTVEAALEALAKTSPAEAAGAGISLEQQTRAAHLFLQAGQTDQAHRWASAVAARDADQGLAWLIAGLASFRANEYPRAVGELNKAAAAMPKRPEPLKGLGEVHAAADQLDPAIAAYRKAVQAAPQLPDLGARLAELLVLDGQIDAAIAELKRILSEDPARSGLRGRLATLLISRDKPEQALSVLDDTPANAPPHVQLHLARGHALLKQDKLAEAEAAFAEAVEMASLSAEGWHFLGVTRLRQRKNAAAIVALDQAITIDSTNPASWEYLGIALANEGKVEKAIATLNRAVQQDVGSGQTHYILSLLYTRQNAAEAALTSLKQAVAADPSYLQRARAQPIFKRFGADSEVGKYLAAPAP